MGDHNRKGDKPFVSLGLFVVAALIVGVVVWALVTL